MLHLGIAQRLKGNGPQGAEIAVCQDIVEDAGNLQVVLVALLFHVTAGEGNVAVEMGGEDISFTPQPEILLVQKRPVAVAEASVIADAAQIKPIGI